MTVLFLLTATIIAQVDAGLYGLQGYEDLQENTELIYRSKSDLLTQTDSMHIATSKEMDKKTNLDLHNVTILRSLTEIKNGTTKVSKQINYDTLSYFPLHIGDKWYYKMSISHIAADSVDEVKIVSNEIIGDTLLQNKKYFIRESHGMESNIYENSKKVFLRVDSISGIVYKYDTDKEFMVDSLLASDNDTIGPLVVNKIFFKKIFNIRIKSKDYGTSYISSYDSYHWELSQMFGLTKIVHADNVSLTKYKYDLIYANIDGNTYGDSLVVSAEKGSADISDKYLLLQNYPNPFNPTTTIQYKIPLSRGVRGVLKKERRETTNSLSAFGVRTTVQLKVYNVLGKEVATLVNKHQKPGTYKITFDATNLSSGVYYYILSVGEYRQVKKMIILK